MKIIDIQKLKEVSTDKNEHDSIRKHYQIIQKVKHMITLGVPNEFIYEMIEEMEDRTTPALIGDEK